MTCLPRPGQPPQRRSVDSGTECVAAHIARPTDRAPARAMAQSLPAYQPLVGHSTLRLPLALSRERRYSATPCLRVVCWTNLSQPRVAQRRRPQWLERRNCPPCSWMSRKTRYCRPSLAPQEEQQRCRELSKILPEAVRPQAQCRPAALRRCTAPARDRPRENSPPVAVHQASTALPASAECRRDRVFDRCPTSERRRSHCSGRNPPDYRCRTSRLDRPSPECLSKRQALTPKEQAQQGARAVALWREKSVTSASLRSRPVTSPRDHHIPGGAPASKPAVTPQSRSEARTCRRQSLQSIKRALEKGH